MYCTDIGINNFLYVFIAFLTKSGDCYDLLISNLENLLLKPGFHYNNQMNLWVQVDNSQWSLFSLKQILNLGIKDLSCTKSIKHQKF